MYHLLNAKYHDTAFGRIRMKIYGVIVIQSPDGILTNTVPTTMKIIK